MHRTVAAISALAFMAINAKADNLSQTDKFKVCARDTAIAEVKKAQLSGEIPPVAKGEMFVAVEPYVDKAYAACAALKPPGVTQPDGQPNSAIQDFVLTALFDMLYASATAPHENK